MLGLCASFHDSCSAEASLVGGVCRRCGAASHASPAGFSKARHSLIGHIAALAALQARLPLLVILVPLVVPADVADARRPMSKRAPIVAPFHQVKIDFSISAPQGIQLDRHQLSGANMAPRELKGPVALKHYP